MVYLLPVGQDDNASGLLSLATYCLSTYDIRFCRIQNIIHSTLALVAQSQQSGNDWPVKAVSEHH